MGLPCPPTEGPPNGYPASEPFKLDYKRWAEEIARLSLQHTNLTGWVIDDFYANHSFFTPAYVGDMRERSQRINARLAFLPLMYFPEITPGFVREYSEVIDGVVIAYPKDREEIKEARDVLDGATGATARQLSFPWGTHSQPGDFVSATMTGTVVQPNHAALHFMELDDFTGATSGYHFKQVLLDGAVIWEEDVAGGSKEPRAVDLDLAQQLKGKDTVKLAFRLVDKQGVSNFGVRWRLKELRAEGLCLAADLTKPEQWQVKKRGQFEAGFGAELRQPRRAVHVPMLVMTAGQASEFRQRHGDPASPARMAEWLKMCLDSWRDGQCDGVVTYCLDKTPRSEVFTRARDLFRGAKR